MSKMYNLMKRLVLYMFVLKEGDRVIRKKEQYEYVVIRAGKPQNRGEFEVMRYLNGGISTRGNPISLRMQDEGQVWERTQQPNIANEVQRWLNPVRDKEEEVSQQQEGYDEWI